MKRVPVTLLALALVTGCGTTVPGAAGPAQGPLGGLEQEKTPAGATLPSSASGSSGIGAISASGAPPSTPRSNLPGIGPAMAGGAIRNGPGVTDTTITMGVAYYDNAAAANAILGAGSVKTSDPVAGTRVLVNDINAHGGIAGRRLLLLTYGIDPQSTAPYSQSAQALCTYFTEDHKVFALIDGAPAAGRLARPCLDKRGVLYLGGSILSDGDFVTGELDPLSLTWAHMFAALPDALVQQGWFGPWNHATASSGRLPVKTGILTVDAPALVHAVDTVLVPGLRRSGHAPDPADIVRIASPQGFSDDGNVVAALHASVLKFRSDGVTHLILTDGNGSMSLLFQNDAASQGYYPRLGGSSGNGWQALLTAGSLPAKTLHGAGGLGWQPLLDLPYTGGEGAYTNAARHACYATFARAGQFPEDANTASGMAASCDIAFLLPRALTGYRGGVDRSVVLNRVVRLGATYQAAGTLGLHFGPTKRDGVGVVSGMLFREGCGCFSYVGRTTAM